MVTFRKNLKKFKYLIGVNENWLKILVGIKSKPVKILVRLKFGHQAQNLAIFHRFFFTDKVLKDFLEMTV